MAHAIRTNLICKTSSILLVIDGSDDFDKAEDICRNKRWLVLTLKV